MKHSQKKNMELTKYMRMLAILLVPMLALNLGTAATEVLAQGELEAKFIFETNFTDEDTGIQIFTDGDPWKEIKIFDPDGKLIFKVQGKGELKDFGLTELFSESNEPNWIEEELLADIVDRFPEGEYVFVGKSVEGESLEGEATLSHQLPCAPTGLLPAEASTLTNGSAVNISWNLVTDILNIATEDCTGGPITDGTIGAYQVVVENLSSEKDFSIFLNGAATVVTLPPQFVTNDSIFKFEVLAIQVVDGEYGNQTIAESFFCTGPAVSPPACVLPED